MAGIYFYNAEANPFPPPVPWTETFTGDNNTSPNSVYWEGLAAYERITIQNNQCNFNTDGAVVYNSQMTSKFNLSGDFDIQTDFQLHTFGAGNSQYAPIMYIHRADNDSVIAWVGRMRSSVGVNGYASDGNTVVVHEYTKADASGKLRITRVGNGFRAYIWNGQWEWNGNTAGRLIGSLVGVDMYIRFRWHNISGNDMEAAIDNFIINSGTAVSP